MDGSEVASAADVLPEPASGIFLEISFRRLLASCEDIAKGTSSARPDLVGTWRSSPVFHHYVDTLQEQLADLEASAGSRLPAALLRQYAAHVDALAAQLQTPDLPAFCAGPALQPTAAAGLHQQRQQQQQQGHVRPPQAPGHPNGTAGEPARAAATDGHAPGKQQLPAVAGVPPVPPRRVTAPPPAPVVRTPQLPLPSTGSGKPAGAGGAAPQPARAAAGSSSGPQSDKLQTQQQLHEDLTDELAGLASQLKNNTLAIEGRLKERERLLDATETALDTSVQKTRESKDQAARIHRKGRANFCLTCLVMLVVGLAFAAMYVFIMLTRVAGYRAVRSSTTTPPAPAPPLLFEPPGHAFPEYDQHVEL